MDMGGGNNGNFAVYFAVSPLPPPPPVLVSPPNGSYNQPSTVRFTWNKSLYAVTDRLQVASDSLFTMIVVNDSTIADSTILVANLTVNRYYWWRVNAKNAVGISPYSASWKFGTFFVGVVQIGSDIPTEFHLSNNYPNPFNPTTKIRFDIPKTPLSFGEGYAPEARGVRLVIYDILGSEVTTLIDGQLKPGTYEVDWDASAYPSGVYFYRLQAGDYTMTKKGLLIK
jgi:hypothetical protein